MSKKHSIVPGAEEAQVEVSRSASSLGLRELRKDSTEKEIKQFHISF